MRKYGESKATRIMMATVQHVTSDLGLRKFQADGFLLTRVYHEKQRYRSTPFYPRRQRVWLRRATPRPLYSWERAHFRWSVVWVSPTVGMNTCVEDESSCPHRRSNPEPSSQQRDTMQTSVIMALTRALLQWKLLAYIEISWAGTASGWTIRGSNPGRGEIFRTRPNRPWGSHTLLYNLYRISFPGGKAAGRGVNLPPSSSAEVKERVQLYLYSLSALSWPVLV